MNTQKTTIMIGGMTCSGCANNVHQALQGLEGVQKVNVNLEKETAFVRHEYSVTQDRFKHTVENAGYKFNGIE
jgi:copper chaperone CopZ